MHMLFYNRSLRIYTLYPYSLRRMFRDEYHIYIASNIFYNNWLDAVCRYAWTVHDSYIFLLKPYYFALQLLRVPKECETFISIDPVHVETVEDVNIGTRVSRLSDVFRNRSLRHVAVIVSTRPHCDTVVRTNTTTSITPIWLLLLPVYLYNARGCVFTDFAQFVLYR